MVKSERGLAHEEVGGIGGPRGGGIGGFISPLSVGRKSKDVGSEGTTNVGAEGSNTKLGNTGIDPNTCSISSGSGNSVC